jgi:GLPGLI family protein
MKRLLLIFLLISLFKSNSQGNKLNSKAIYIANIVTEFENDTKNSTQFETINSILIQNPVKFVLIFNNRESFYEVQKEVDSDDIKEKISRSLYGASSKSYINMNNNEAFDIVEAYGEKFRIINEDRNWQLTKEKRKIGDYICYKANTNYQIRNSKGVFTKNVVAWYAPNLNFPFGPKGFHGLPGLILELIDDKYRYKLAKLILNSSFEKIKRPTSGKAISKAEFEQIGIDMDNRKY